MRATSRIVRIPSPTDREVQRFLIELTNNINISEIKLYISRSLIATIDGSKESIESAFLKSSDTEYTIKDYIFDGKYQIIDKVIVNTDGQTKLELERCITEFHTGNTHTKNPSLSESEVFIYNEQNSSGLDYIPLMRSITGKAFKPISLNIKPSQNQTLIQNEVASLAEISRRMAEKLSESLSEAHNKSLETRKQLDDEYKKKRDQLDADTEKKLIQIDNERQRLESIRSELDDRQARHARRALRQEITSNIKRRLAKGAGNYPNLMGRIIVSVISSVAFMFGIYQVINSAEALSQLSGDIDSHYYIGLIAFRLIGGTALSVIMLFYLIGYWRSNTTKDEEFDRTLERYSLDIDRSSWIVETLIEVRGEDKERDVPEEWLKGATRNLFPFDEAQNIENDNAMDALAELLKKGTKLEIGPNGAHVEITPSAAKKIGRSQT